MLFWSTIDNNQGNENYNRGRKKFNFYIHVRQNSLKHKSILH